MTTNLERAVFNVILRPDWHASSRNEFIALGSGTASASIIKSDVVGFCVEEVRQEQNKPAVTCFSVLVKRYAIFRFFPVNALHAQQIYRKFSEEILVRPEPEPDARFQRRKSDRDRPTAKAIRCGVDALNEED